MATITLWKDSAIGAIYNPQTAQVAYGKKNADGCFKIFISDSAGGSERRLTWPLWKEDRHHWAEEWHPSGEFLFCIIEKNDYNDAEKKHHRSSIDATPGYGAYSDLWCIRSDGSEAWKLTDLPNLWSSAIIHCAISRDGKYFGWSERIKSPKYSNKNLAAGVYVFRIAEFYVEPEPHFENIRTFVPGNVDALNEMESFSPDAKQLAFYSSFETGNILNTPIYTLDFETGEIKKLTSESFAQAPVYTPDGQHIVYMTGQDCDIFPFQLQGADWWIMNPDGTEKKRLTFMNVKDHIQSVNKFRLAGSVSFINDHSFFGGVMTKSLGLTGFTVRVDF